MSNSPTLEIDFFRLKEESSPKKQLSTRRNIQDMISKINPEAVASAIANTGLLAYNKSYTSSLPVYNHESGGVNMASSAPPLTIIYNGTVSVFDVSRDKADNIMKLAEKVNSVAKTVVEPTLAVKVESDQSPAIQGALTKDLPMSRKKSLKRFLEKRKERQVSVSPYASLH
ncbi:protein TIFY 9-like [Bidens hawaiensis]|uniref:protein TIFY 9-like n=1 Tax=Bidens hawaiensis TaxID=980011 RepID=UPI004049882E